MEVTGHQVTILGPGGFRHALTLPAAADPARLHAALYRGFLELRAPRGVAEGTVVRRTVQVESRS